MVVRGIYIYRPESMHHLISEKDHDPISPGSGSARTRTVHAPLGVVASTMRVPLQLAPSPASSAENTVSRNATSGGETWGDEVSVVIHRTRSVGQATLGCKVSCSESFTYEATQEPRAPTRASTWGGCHTPKSKLSLQKCTNAAHVSDVPRRLRALWSHSTTTVCHVPWFLLVVSDRDTCQTTVIQHHCPLMGAECHFPLFSDGC